MIKEALLRISAPMPLFFKRLRSFVLLYISGPCTAIVTASKTSLVPIPEWILTWAGYGVIGGLLIAAFCHLPVDDNKVQL